MRGATKRVQIKQVWDWSGESLPLEDPLLQGTLDHGELHPGTAYNTRRWKELEYFVRILRAWRKLPVERQREIAGDAWEFGTWLDAVPETGGAQTRHILPHLLFPDVFQRVGSEGQKRKIIKGLSKDDDPKVDYSDRLELDRRLLLLRERLEPEAEGEFSFYSPEIKAKWSKDPSPTAPNVASAADRAWFQETIGDHRVWIISPGERARLWSEFRDRGFIAIGWDDLEDLSQYANHDEVTQALREAYDYAGRPVNDSRACWQFVQEMAVGDYVLAKEGRSRVLGLGRVESDYRFDPERTEYRNVREVRWERTGEWDLPDDRRSVPKTLTDYTPYPDWVRFAFSLVEKDPVPNGGSGSESAYTLDQAMEGLFLPRAEFQRIVDTLARKKNVILQGPPGVGKSFVAKRVAYRLLGKRDPERVEMIQFHQSYSYEDFIQGWRPTEDGGFHLKDGVFYQFCEAAQRDPDHDYVFIIDEINRGNLSKIFGELMLLLEADKRGPSFAVPTTYSSEREDRFYIPGNLHLLGLMNTADRSLAMVDYALRRRFAFVTLSPQIGAEAFSDYLLEAGVSEELLHRLVERVGELNEAIRADRQNLGPGYEIGHSFFCPRDSDESLDEAWFKEVVRSEIAPLVREYWFDREEEAEQRIARLSS